MWGKVFSGPKTPALDAWDIKQTLGSKEELAKHANAKLAAGNGPCTSAGSSADSNSNGNSNSNSNSNSKTIAAPGGKVCFRELAVGIFGPAAPMTVASWNTPCSRVSSSNFRVVYFRSLFFPYAAV
jgi:hypothetical protein